MVTDDKGREKQRYKVIGGEVITKGEKYDKGKGSITIKILSIQVGGASS